MEVPQVIAQRVKPGDFSETQHFRMLVVCKSKVDEATAGITGFGSWHEEIVIQQSLASSIFVLHQALLAPELVCGPDEFRFRPLLSVRRKKNLPAEVGLEVPRSSTEPESN